MGYLEGLPSSPHGAWLNPEKESKEFLGAIFSNVKVVSGDSFTRPSAGGGGLGDPLNRDPSAVLEDVIDEYVSIERAKKDYGVVIIEIDRDIDLFEIDELETIVARKNIRMNRKKWLQQDIQTVESMYLTGEIDELDLIRKFGVVFDYATNKVLPNSTQQYRDMLEERMVPHWS